MKKAKSVLSILAMAFAFVGMLVLLLVPVFDMIGGASVDFSAHMNSVFGQLPKLFSFAGALPIVTFVVAALGVAGLIAAMVLVIVKKQTKELGIIIPLLVLVIVAFLAVGALVADFGGTSMLKEMVGADGKYFAFEETKIGAYIALICGALGLVLGLVAAVLYVIMYAKFDKKAAAAEEAKQKDNGTVAEKGENVMSEKVEETPTKVVRHILVHRSGKVVRVLNERYYDVTTNIYVEPGYENPADPKETEQEHYEKILGAAKEPVKEEKPAPAPAPVVAPAPAPVAEPVEETPAQKAERVPFTTRIKEADKALKEAYNELKSEVLSYGIKSRVSTAGDTFRLHTKTYVKMVVAGKSLKLYFALNPADYKDSTFPIGDASGKVLHQDTPLVFKVKSDLSIRRAKVLIADAAKKDGLEQGEVVKANHAKELLKK